MRNHYLSVDGKLYGRVYISHMASSWWVFFMIVTAVLEVVYADGYLGPFLGGEKAGYKLST